MNYKHRLKQAQAHIRELSKVNQVQYHEITRLNALVDFLETRHKADILKNEALNVELGKQAAERWKSRGWVGAGKAQVINQFLN